MYGAHCASAYGRLTSLTTLGPIHLGEVKVWTRATAYELRLCTRMPVY